MRRLETAFGLCLLGMIIATPAFGTDEYRLTRYVFSSVAAEAGADGYTGATTAGEPIIGDLADAGWSVQQGFWFPITNYASVAPTGVTHHRFELRPNVPNPFNPVTTFLFSVPGQSGTEAMAMLTIYDIQGRRVVELLNTPLSAGEHAITWSG